MDSATSLFDIVPFNPDIFVSVSTLKLVKIKKKYLAFSLKNSQCLSYLSLID